MSMLLALGLGPPSQMELFTFQLSYKRKQFHYLNTNIVFLYTHIYLLFFSLVLISLYCSKIEPHLRCQKQVSPNVKKKFIQREKSMHLVCDNYDTTQFRLSISFCTKCINCFKLISYLKQIYLTKLIWRMWMTLNLIYICKVMNPYPRHCA